MPSSTKRRSQYVRKDRDKQTYTTAQDRDILTNLYHLRFATTSELITSLAATRNPGGVTRRLLNLLDAGMVDRVYLPPAFAFSSGGREAIWYLGTGVVDEITKHRREMQIRTPAERRDYIDTELTALCRPQRDAKASLLEAAFHFTVPKDRIVKMLDKNEALAIRIALGESSEIRHFLLCSEILSLVTLACAHRQIHITDIRTDAAVSYQVLLTSANQTFKQYAVTAKSKTYFPIEPDLLLVLDQNGRRDALFIEAETGTNSRAKIESKIAFYLAAQQAGELDALLAENDIHPVSSFRVVFITKDPSHMNMAMTALHDVQARGSGLFLFGHLSKGCIEWTPESVPTESIKNNWRTAEVETWRLQRTKPDTTRKDVAGVRVLEAMTQQFSRPLFLVLRDVPVNTKREELPAFVQSVALLA